MPEEPLNARVTGALFCSLTRSAEKNLLRGSIGLIECDNSSLLTRGLIINV
jgi:AMMECR1 domain-containing protein